MIKQDIPLGEVMEVGGKWFTAVDLSPYPMDEMACEQCDARDHKACLLLECLPWKRKDIRDVVYKDVAKL